MRPSSNRWQALRRGFLAATLLGILAGAPAAVSAPHSAAVPGDQPELDLVGLSRAQYLGAISMAMEGMRLVYGEMTPAEEARFEADWEPLFAYPTAAVIDYLNALNPLLVRFLTVRDTLNETLASYHALALEMTVALAEDMDDALHELVASYEWITLSLAQQEADLQRVVAAIVALGDPPTAEEHRRRQQETAATHAAALEIIRELAAKPPLQIDPPAVMAPAGATLSFLPTVEPAFAEGSRLRWLFADGRSVEGAIDEQVSHRLFAREEAASQPLTVQLWSASGELIAAVRVPIDIRLPGGQWVLVDREILREYPTRELRNVQQTGRTGERDPATIVLAEQDLQFDAGFGTMGFLNVERSQGWRVHLGWQSPPPVLLPDTRIRLGVEARMDHVATHERIAKGRIETRLRRIRPWAEQDDIQWNAEARVRAEVDLGALTADQHEDMTIPRPYVMEAFGQRRAIDPTGQRLMIDIEASMLYPRIGLTGATNAFTVRYIYQWDPTGDTFARWGEVPATPTDGEALDPAQLDALAQRAQIAFHRQNIAHFEDAIRAVQRQLAQATDPDAHNALTRDLLYQQDALQRQRDAITTLETGQFTRTRTDLDALNMWLMRQESARRAAEANAVVQVLERLPRLIALAEDPAERRRLADFSDRHLSDRHGEPLSADDARRVLRMVGNQVLGHLEVEAAQADLAAIDAAQRLQQAENVKTFADYSLMALSTLAPVYHAYNAPHFVVAGMRAQQAARAYMLYQGTTGYIEGGIAQAFTSVASSYNSITSLAHAGMQGYQRGVLAHLEAHAADPGSVVLDETRAGLGGALWGVGTTALKSYVTSTVIGGLMPPRDPPGPTEQWPTIEEQLQEARFRSRQANGRATVRLFQQRAARLADAGRAGAPREQILALRDGMNQAYVAVKSDYFAKMHMNALARRGDTKLAHYYNSAERQYLGRLTREVERRMTEAGFSPQEYRSFSNSASKGKVGMDLDFGVVEPPRYLLRDGVRVPNPAHAAWRRNITQTLADGRVVRRSPYELQIAGHDALHAAYQDVYGRPAGEAMVEFTSSYHPEAYRDLSWLGARGSKTALVFDTDPAWVQQATDVTRFKVDNLPHDHPQLGSYGVMQERARGLVKDFDTKIEPMIGPQQQVNPRAVRHALQLREVMHRFAQDEIGPIEADHRIRELTGGNGLEEVAERMAVLMRGLRATLPERGP